MMNLILRNTCCYFASLGVPRIVDRAMVNGTQGSCRRRVTSRALHKNPLFLEWDHNPYQIVSIDEVLQTR